MKRTRVALLTILALALTACGAGGAVSGGARPTARPSDQHSGAHSGLHGSPETAPATAPLRGGERFVTLTMPKPYTPKPPNGGTDEYRCFLIDPGLKDGDTFLTGTQFAAQNGDVVHHAILFRVDADKVAGVRAHDAKEPGEGWGCFGDAGVGDADWIGHWAPGTSEILLDPKLGYPMAAGSALIMQVHYSTLAIGDRPAGEDQSSVRLRLTTGKLTPLRTELFMAPIELPCTAEEKGALCEREAAIADVSRRFSLDAKEQTTALVKWCSGGEPSPGPTQHCDMPIQEPATLHALAGHMHLLGRSIKVELNPGKSGARTLLDVPRYDFDNQALQPLAEPVTVKPGDTIRTTCTHDASLRAQLPLLRDLPPRYVVWGEGTQDEMCLGIVVAS
ncbi:monooxygenase [Nonomuraea roseola]|uniref:Monooxygenase n=1 Tax=Nonomuraea roseola TaxID=46179 RepID=A0ABV5Q7J8_9ACTN